jgi:uncharacterized protein (DUF2236 family)
MIRLPHSLQGRLEALSAALLQPAEGARIDFTVPAGEPALVGPDSVSWRIFKNPIALLVGGIAAVILELSEPAVRTGVWNYSSFPTDPMGRLRRTGLAAMVTVYGARSVAEPMIAGIVRMHARVTGETPAGEIFSANDVRLLSWVHATASYGFGEAYSRYVSPLSRLDFDRLHAEGMAAARCYGALDAPTSQAHWETMLSSMRGRLEPSDVLSQFLRIMCATPALPAPLRWMQPMLVRAAIALVPEWLRSTLTLTAFPALSAPEKWLVKLTGAALDKIVLPDSPPSQACRRLGLPSAYLYAQAPAPAIAAKPRSLP